MIVFIPHRFPGRNEQEKAARGHKMAAAQMKKKYTDLAWVYFVGKPKAIKKQDFVFTWFEPDMRRDPDNIHGGIKFILDGMKNAGFIENDGQKQVGIITHIVESNCELDKVGVLVSCKDSKY